MGQKYNLLSTFSLVALVTAWVCFGEMAFLGNLDMTLASELVLLVEISGLEGDFKCFSCFRGDFLVDDRLLSLFVLERILMTYWLSMLTQLLQISNTA